MRNHLFVDPCELLHLFPYNEKSRNAADLSPVAVEIRAVRVATCKGKAILRQNDTH